MFKAAKRSLLQAYPNAPWRNQAQVIGVFAVGVVITALLASVYLAVSVKAANLGRETQEIQLEILDLQRKNANLETQLASLTSATRMRIRAEKLGFRQLTSFDLEYLPVPGYTAAGEAVLAPGPGPAIADFQQVPPELNQTLFDWLRQKIENPETFTGASNLFSLPQPESQPEP